MTNRFRLHSIRTRLALGAAAFLLFLAAAGYVSLRLSSSYLSDAYGGSMVALSEAMLGEMEQVLGAKLEMLRRFGWEPQFRKQMGLVNAAVRENPSPDTMMADRDKEWRETLPAWTTPFMTSVLDNPLSSSLRERFITFYQRESGYSVFESLFITDLRGGVVAATRRTSRYDYSGEDWWREAMDSGVAVPGVVYDDSLGGYGLSVAVRLDDDQGRAMGVARALLSSGWFMREAQDATGIGSRVGFRLVTRGGRLLYSSKPFRFHEDVSERPFFRNAQGERGFFLVKEGGRPTVAAFATVRADRKLKDADWILFSFQDEAEILGPMFLLRRAVAAAFGVMALVWISVALFLSRSMLRSVDRLQVAARAVADGDLSRRVEETGRDELADLGRSFNQMTSALLASRRELEQEKEFVTAVLRNSYDGIAVVALDGAVQFFSPGMERLFGCSAEEALSMEALADRAFRDPAERREALAQWREDAAMEGDPPARVFLIAHSDGSMRWCRLKFSHMPDGAMVVNGQDITENKLAEQHIEYLALHDALTGLPTRRLFQDRLQQAMASARRRKTQTALLYVDLDRFKLVNDARGHDAGDAVLRVAAERLTGSLRASDTVARLGGDEFAAILPDVEDREHAAGVAAKIIRNLIRVVVTAHGEFFIGASVGISFFPEDGGEEEELIRAADKAMYVAKGRGGNTYCFSTECADSSGWA